MACCLWEVGIPPGPKDIANFYQSSENVVSMQFFFFTGRRIRESVILKGRNKGQE